MRIIGYPSFPIKNVSERFSQLQRKEHFHRSEYRLRSQYQFLFGFLASYFTPLRGQNAAIGEVLQSIKGMKKGLILLD